MFKFKNFILLFILIQFAVPVFSDQIVVFNKKTGVYHKQACIHALLCSRNCVKMRKTEAVIRKARPCKFCKG